MAALDHPGLAGTDQRRYLLVDFSFLGLPVSEDRVRGGVGDPGDEDGTADDAFCGSLLAAELGLRAPFDAGRERLAAMGQTGLAELAHVYWDWRQEGASEEAARRLLARVGPPSRSTHCWTFWLGEIQRELGELEAAREAYRTSLKPLSFSEYALGPLQADPEDLERRGPRADADRCAGFRAGPDDGAPLALVVRHSGHECALPRQVDAHHLRTFRVSVRVRSRQPLGSRRAPAPYLLAPREPYLPA